MNQSWLLEQWRVLMDPVDRFSIHFKLESGQIERGGAFRSPSEALKQSHPATLHEEDEAKAMRQTGDAGVCLASQHSRAAH